MDALKSRFIINLTHEFRTPLSLILGPAEKIHQETQDPAVRQQTSSIKRNANRLLNLINQLLDLGKLESGKMEVVLKACDVVNLTKQILGTFKPLAEEKQIELLFTSSHDAVLTGIDQNKLEMILHNILSNALKFSRRGESIEVT